MVNDSLRCAYVVREMHAECELSQHAARARRAVQAVDVLRDDASPQQPPLLQRGDGKVSRVWPSPRKVAVSDVGPRPVAAPLALIRDKLPVLNGDVALGVRTVGRAVVGNAVGSCCATTARRKAAKWKKRRGLLGARSTWSTWSAVGNLTSRAKFLLFLAFADAACGRASRGAASRGASLHRFATASAIRPYLLDCNCHPPMPCHRPAELELV